MKFRAERDTLVAALTTASRAVPSRQGVMPILRGVHITAQDDRLTVIGSDTDITIITAATVKTDHDDVCVLPARLALDSIKSLEPGVVTVEISDDGDDAEILGGRTRFNLRTLPADEWPTLADWTQTGITIPTGELDAALKQVIPAAGREDHRPILTGVLCAIEDDHVRFVATDSYRLAVRDVPGVATLFEGDRDKALIPAAVLTELLRLTGKGGQDVHLSFGDRDMQVSTADTIMYGRLIEGEFPNYKGLIPTSYPYRLTVDKAAFTEAAERVALMARDAIPVRCVLTADGVEMTATAQDVGNAHEIVDGTWTGPELTVGFNPQYLLAGAEQCVGDTLFIDLMDALKPAVLTTHDPNYLYLLMPVRIS